MAAAAALRPLMAMFVPLNLVEFINYNNINNTASLKNDNIILITA